MIIVDVNLLLYAQDAASAHHDKARPWLERALSTPQPVGLPWPTILAFLRISTNARAMASPLAVDEATSIVSSWLARPMVFIPKPTDSHWEVLQHLVRQGQARANLIPDAHLAALAIEHGATLCSADRDFARFDGLNWINPLEGQTL